MVKNTKLDPNVFIVGNKNIAAKAHFDKNGNIDYFTIYPILNIKDKDRLWYIALSPDYHYNMVLDIPILGLQASTFLNELWRVQSADTQIYKISHGNTYSTYYWNGFSRYHIIMNNKKYSLIVNAGANTVIYDDISIPEIFPCDKLNAKVKLHVNNAHNSIECISHIDCITLGYDYLTTNK